MERKKKSLPSPPLQTKGQVLVKYARLSIFPVCMALFHSKRKKKNGGKKEGTISFFFLSFFLSFSVVLSFCLSFYVWCLIKRGAVQPDPLGPSWPVSTSISPSIHPWPHHPSPHSRLGSRSCSRTWAPRPRLRAERYSPTDHN